LPGLGTVPRGEGGVCRQAGAAIPMPMARMRGCVRPAEAFVTGLLSSCVLM
jgi:hypothetical protein